LTETTVKLLFWRKSIHSL